MEWQEGKRREERGGRRRGGERRGKGGGEGYPPPNEIPATALYTPLTLLVHTPLKDIL